MYSKKEADQLRSISISDLEVIPTKEGTIRMRWKWGNADVLNVPFFYFKEEGNPERVGCTFIFDVRSVHGTRREQQYFELEYTECNYGGRRYWFTCDCMRRVGKLYINKGYLACRHCHNLTYQSRNASHYKGLTGVLHRQLKFEKKLKKLKRSIIRTRYAGNCTKKQAKFMTLLFNHRTHFWIDFPGIFE